MPEYTKEPTTAWSNEYTRPELAGLLGGLEEKERAAFDAALQGLLARKGCKERVEWMGLPWRWTVLVGRSGSEGPSVAYLVPRPGGPIACLPVPVEGPGAPNPAELTKAVRVVLERAPVIAGYAWPEWAIGELDLVAVRPLLDARDQSVS
jgi:hypothetical protein